MYLFAGMDTVIHSEDIIGIFDLDKTSVSRHTRAFLARAQKQDRVVAITNELPRSFLICGDKKETRVYLSQISPVTLKKRSAHLPEAELLK